MAGVNALLDLALWKEPKKSGAVFGAATTLYVLFERLRYTALALVSQVLLALVVGSFLWSMFCKFSNRPAPGPLRVDLSEAAARTAVAKAIALLNKALVLFHKLTTGADPKLSGQAAFLLWVASKVGSWFSFVTLAYMGKQSEALGCNQRWTEPGPDN